MHDLGRGFTVARRVHPRGRTEEVTSPRAFAKGVSGVPVELRSTIDYRWLEEAAKADPMVHAYTLWNLVHYPDRIRFVSAVRGGTTVGYLLVWLGRPTRPVVHWFGHLPETAALVAALPPPPFATVVPPEIEPLVTGTRGAASTHAVLTMLRDRGAVDCDPTGTAVRRVTRADRPALEAWAQRTPDPVVVEYAASDPEAEHLWAVFEGAYIVGIAGAAVRLATIWVVAGVFVDPLARRRGVGRALMTAILGAAESAGASVGLHVREDALAARALYDGLGFRPVGRNLWLEYAGVWPPG